jgi:hypothetical protein
VAVTGALGVAAGCGEGDAGEATRPRSAALRSVPAPHELAMEDGVRFLEDALDGEKADVELLPGQGIHIDDEFETMPRELTFDTGGGEATATLLPKGEVYRAVDGVVTFPVSSGGTCVQLDFERGHLAGRWTLALERRGSNPDCDGVLGDVGSYTATPDGPAEYRVTKICWFRCRLGQGCKKLCRITYHSQGWP